MKNLTRAVYISVGIVLGILVLFWLLTEHIVVFAGMVICALFCVLVWVIKQVLDIIDDDTPDLFPH